MLNESQIKWTSARAQAIIDYAAERGFVLSDNDWEALTFIVNEAYGKSKGNEEVKDVLMFSVKYIEVMQKIMKGDNYEHLRSMWQ